MAGAVVGATVLVAIGFGLDELGAITEGGADVLGAVFTVPEVVTPALLGAVLVAVAELVEAGVEDGFVAPQPAQISRTNKSRAATGFMANRLPGGRRGTTRRHSRSARL